MFKNQFHASYPIQNSSKSTWNFSLTKLNKTNSELITEITPNLIKYLISQTENKNFEIRETIFKSLDYIFQNSSSNYLENEEIIKKILKSLNNEVLRYFFL
jgi:hypothetical protein